MKLYYDPISTTCRPVMLFAAEHDIAFEDVFVELMAGGAHSPEYLAVNPNGIVPFLVDEDLAMGESSAILKYLADKVGSKTYPKGLKARAKVNETMDWINCQFHRDFCLFLVYPQVLPPDHMPPNAENLVSFGEAQSRRWLKILNDQLDGQAFLCGDEITIADYMGSAHASLGDLIGFDFSPWPNVARWMRTMKDRPAWAMVNAGFNGWQAAVQGRVAAE